jgi:hypothetical protein
MKKKKNYMDMMSRICPVLLVNHKNKIQGTWTRDGTLKNIWFYGTRDGTTSLIHIHSPKSFKYMPLALLGSVSAEWAPLSSSGIFLSILSCNLQIGPVITMPLAGQLCSSPNWGWPPVYYILGTLSLLFFLSFFCFFRDSPRQHRWASRHLRILWDF